MGLAVAGTERAAAAPAGRAAAQAAPRGMKVAKADIASGVLWRGVSRRKVCVPAPLEPRTLRQANIPLRTRHVAQH
jgi:hypothetical protein